MQLLGGDGGLHDLGGVVNLAILDHLKALIDHTLESVLALEVTSERAASKEARQEVLEHVNLREVKTLIGQLGVLDHTLGGFTTVLLELGLSEADVSKVGCVHDRLDGHVMEFLGAQCL